MFELGIQKNWIDALYARSSVRQYTGAPDKEQLDRLGETCRKLSWQGVKIRMFKGPGLKSQIKGTDVYAVIVAKRGTPMEVEGYMGEALVLEATSMGLGTCWLGAGFYPDIINRNVDLQTDEAVHCVISIGKANLPAFAPKRKELVKVCGMDEAQLGQLGAWQKEAVLAARLAPSARSLRTRPAFPFWKRPCSIRSTRRWIAASACCTPPSARRRPDAPAFGKRWTADTR